MLLIIHYYILTVPRRALLEDLDDDSVVDTLGSHGLRRVRGSEAWWGQTPVLSMSTFVAVSKAETLCCLNMRKRLSEAKNAENEETKIKNHSAFPSHVFDLINDRFGHMHNSTEREGERARGREKGATSVETQGQCI